MITKIKDIKVGDLFSEESHYVVEKINNISVVFRHLATGKNVELTNEYIKSMLKTADQYEQEIKVNKEDSKDGMTKGIRTIWEELSSSQVFTVVFEKQGKKKSAKKYQEELAQQRQLAVDAIEKAKKQKKSMADAYTAVLSNIQRNPVLDYEPGEERILRGYKIQFTSRDGRYNCVDVDLVLKGEANPIRPVNINTIKSLYVNGIKYTVK